MLTGSFSPGLMEMFKQTNIVLNIHSVYSCQDNPTAVSPHGSGNYFNITHFTFKHNSSAFLHLYGSCQNTKVMWNTHQQQERICDSYHECLHRELYSNLPSTNWPMRELLLKGFLLFRVTEENPSNKIHGLTDLLRTKCLACVTGLFRHFHLARLKLLCCWPPTSLYLHLFFIHMACNDSGRMVCEIVSRIPSHQPFSNKTRGKSSL